MWPVDGVIGENGGFYMRMTDQGLQRVFRYDEGARAGFRKRLEQIREEVLTRCPDLVLRLTRPIVNTTWPLISVKMSNH